MRFQKSLVTLFLILVLIATNLNNISSSSEEITLDQLSNPEFNIKETFTRGSSDAAAIEIQGKYGYIADGLEGLRIVNITNFEIKSTLTSVIKTVKVVPISGFAQDVVVDGNFAYVAAYYGGLVIVNITEPESATMISSLVTNRPASNIDKQGDIVYIADRFPSATYVNLEAIDVSDPTNPIRLDTALISSNTDGMYVNGSYAFVVSTYHVDIVNITDPTNIETISQIDHFYFSNDVRVRGNYVYIAYSFGMYIYDVSDIFNPVQVYNYNIGKSAIAIDLYDWKVILAGSTWIQELSLAAPDSPTFDRETIMPDGFVRGVALNGSDLNFVYAASGTQGVHTISINADAATLGVIGNLNPPSDNFEIIEKYNGYLYIKTGYDYISVYDVSLNQTNPIFVTDIQLADFVVDFMITSHKLFIANNYDGLVIYDILDPTSPTLWDEITVGSPIGDVYVEGNYAYTLTQSGLNIIDISTQGALSSLSSITLPGSDESIIKSGSIVYVTNQNGFLSIDVSDPNSPQLLDSFDTAGLTRGAVIRNNVAYVLESSIGVKLIDISNPSNLTLISTFNLNVLLSRAHEIGDLLFLTADYAGFTVLNISSPLNPVIYGSHDHPSTSFPTKDMFVDGNIIYAAYAQGGCDVIELVDVKIDLPTQTVISSVTSFEVSIQTELISKYITETESLSLSLLFLIAIIAIPIMRKKFRQT